MALTPLVGANLTFTLFFPAVLFSAWFGGFRAGMLSLALSALIGAFVTFDGESIWMEGVALVGLYVMIAASFWWG